jgi:hypothetical protein
MREEVFSITEIKEELTSSDLVYFKYAPIASVDVERSFPNTRMCWPTTDIHSPLRTCACSLVSTAKQTEVRFNVL